MRHRSSLSYIFKPISTLSCTNTSSFSSISASSHSIPPHFLAVYCLPQHQLIVFFLVSLAAKILCIKQKQRATAQCKHTVQHGQANNVGHDVEAIKIILTCATRSGNIKKNTQKHLEKEQKQQQ